MPSARALTCPTAATTRASATQRLRWVADIALALHRIPKPVIAKVNGVAVGAGMNLALGCDLVVASEQARFSEIFARRGLTIDFGGSWLLPRLVGMHRAKELALLADIISAKEAEEMGLVNRVVSAGELDAFVDDWAERLAAGPPIALGMTKRLLSNSFSMTMDEALEAEGMAQSVNSGTEDTAGGHPRVPRKARPQVQGPVGGAPGRRPGQPSRFLWKRPPFMMAERWAPWSWKSLRLSSGLPSTISRSAKAPGAITPSLPSWRRTRAPTVVAEWMTSMRRHHLAANQELAALLLLELPEQIAAVGHGHARPLGRARASGARAPAPRRSWPSISGVMPNCRRAAPSSPS